MAIPNTFADKTGEVLLGNLDYNFQVLDIGITNLQTEIGTLDSRVDAIESGTVDLTGYATETYVNNAVSGLVDSAPDALNTLNELAAALGDDSNFATTVTNSLAGKADLSGAAFTGPIAINDTDLSTSDLYINASPDKWGVVIKKDFDSPDEPASLLIATDGDGTDDIAFEVRGNTTGSSVDVTNLFSSADTKFVIFGDGSTLIGYNNIGTTYTAPAMLAVNGSITATGDVTAYYSDERLKTKLGNIDNALDKVSTLNGFYYEANDKAVELGYTKKREVGLSAQEVEKVLPEVVVPAPIDPEYKTMHYERVIPLLVEAIKELNEKIKVLENK